MLRTPLALLLGTLLHPMVASQQTLVVGPGGFAQVQQAINAASPGDRIVIGNGLFNRFTVDRGVRIFPGGGAVLQGCTFANIPAGQRAILASAVISATPGTVGIEIRNCQGAVQLTDVGVSSCNASALTVDGSRLVHLQDIDVGSSCPAIGATPEAGVRITNSSVTMRDSDVIGQGSIGGLSGDGIRVSNSEFFAYDSRISSGLDLLTFQSTGPSLTGSATSSTLVECTFAGNAVTGFDYSDCTFSGVSRNNLPLLTEFTAPFEVSLGAGNGAWNVLAEGPPNSTVGLFLGLVRGPLPVPSIRGSLRLDPTVLIPVATLTPNQLPGAFLNLTFPNVPQAIDQYLDFQGVGLANGIAHFTTPLSVRITP